MSNVPVTVTLKNDQTLIIREAEKSDASKLLEYLPKVGGESPYLTFGSEGIRMSLEEEEVFIEQCQHANNKLILIAEVDFSIVGNLVFQGGPRPRIEHTGEFGVAVLRQYWGLGIGTMLVEQLITWAKSSKIIRKINLKVSSDNQRAIEVYKRIGFVQEGVISRALCISGHFYDDLIMGMPID